MINGLERLFSPRPFSISAFTICLSFIRATKISSKEFTSSSPDLLSNYKACQLVLSGKNHHDLFHSRSLIIKISLVTCLKRAELIQGVVQ